MVGLPLSTPATTGGRYPPAQRGGAALRRARDVVLDIEVNGARQVLCGCSRRARRRRSWFRRRAGRWWSGWPARRTEDRAALTGGLAIAVELAAVGEYDGTWWSTPTWSRRCTTCSESHTEGRRVARQDDLDIRTERLRREIAEAATQL